MYFTISVMLLLRCAGSHDDTPDDAAVAPGDAATSPGSRQLQPDDRPCSATTALG